MNMQLEIKLIVTGAWTQNLNLDLSVAIFNFNVLFIHLQM